MQYLPVQNFLPSHVTLKFPTFMLPSGFRIKGVPHSKHVKLPESEGFTILESIVLLLNNKKNYNFYFPNLFNAARKFALFGVLQKLSVHWQYNGSVLDEQYVVTLEGSEVDVFGGA
jgi:hypothetical protein